MQKNRLKNGLALALVATSFLVVGYLEQKIQSASLTNVSVTLTNPRLSFRGALGAGNTAGSSVVVLDTDPGDYPSTSSAQLVEGDSLLIGEAGSLGSYTVASTSSVSTLTITSALAAGDADAGDDVISTQSANHIIRFTTVNAITDGTFRILVPALDDDTASADGIPDGGYFDFGTTAPTVNCPTNLTGYTFAAGSAAASSVTIDNNDYHSFECSYTGAGAVGTDFGTTYDPIEIIGLINPAPKADHSTGTADTYKVIIQHLDDSDNVQDSTSVSIGVIEAVRVTASVPAQISFQIIGLAAGTSACGTTTDVATTPAAVPFGEVSISAFNDAAQALTVTTNALNGFAVTAIENDQLGLNGGTCTGDPDITSNTSCIADSRGDNGTMADATSDEWNNTANKGFAYSLDDLNGSTTEAFVYNESGRTFSARQFADAENGGTVQTIFSSTGPADNHNLYVCYRVLPGTTTAAGNYENAITYTATATF